MPIKDIVYLALIAIVIGGAIYERQHLINEGEAICLAREKAAAEKQAIADTKIAEDTVNALQAEIDRLRGGTAPATTRVQCYARKVPAAPSEPAASGESATPRAVVPEVPAGSGAGVEVGASLQRLALAADLLSARYRACLKELQEP